MQNQPQAVSEEIAAAAANSVAVVKCADYDPRRVRNALRRGLDLLGDPQRFIKPGDRILLKPNMLSAKSPDRAVTTHPEIITAMGEIVLDCRGKVIIGDSPAGMAKNIEHHWEKTGIAAAAARLNAELVCFEDRGIRSYQAPDGYVSISETVLEADGIINLPKLKTHMLTRMTGAVKNMFGVVPGFRKSYLHSLAPEPLPFCRFVIAVYRRVIPALNVMDAVTAMEGNGPSSGKPVRMGAVILSRDALALDQVACRLIGENPRDLPMFRAAQEAGLWDPDADPPNLLGDNIEAMIPGNFQPPDASRLERIPPFIKNNLKRVFWIRPRADRKLCSSCGLCIENCPQQAMRFVKDVPKIDYDRCIKCSCCDEICPENAIYQQMSLLAKLIS